MTWLILYLNACNGVYFTTATRNIFKLLGVQIAERVLTLIDCEPEKFKRAESHFLHFSSTLIWRSTPNWTGISLGVSYT